MEHTYKLALTVTVRGAQEPTPSPIGHVTDAVSTLLSDNAHAWLLEAIGHPHPDGFEITVTERE